MYKLRGHWEGPEGVKFGRKKRDMFFEWPHTDDLRH